MQPSGQNSEIDLREYYITPLYLETMAIRARSWSVDFIQLQLKQFLATIPDYPEVMEILEGEIHRRKLNEIKKKARTLPEDRLIAFQKSLNDPDEKEVVETEIQIRGGARELPDHAAK